jgi:phosphoenolpyruvate carboxylase
MQRKIPSTMASQHPDNASKPYWHTQSFIGVGDEYKESYLAFSELGIDEYKWDWEGKLVDESVMERLIGTYTDYFSKNQIGKEKFLTFRLPNPKVETEFRIGRAFLCLLNAATMAKQFNLHTPPLFEVILPMTESAQEMVDIQEAFQEIGGLKHKLYKMEKKSLSILEVIPLFEQVSTIINSDKILAEYISGYAKTFKKKPVYLRPYVARSDPALNAGIVPTVLAIKIALSKYKQFAARTKIPLYPIIGCAALPFRGGLTPYAIEDFVQEYKGVKTVLIQSGFRYDYPKDAVIKGIKQLNTLLPKMEALSISKNEEQQLIQMLPYFENAYRATIEDIAPLINQVASFIPKRRERVQHVGLFGYSRGVGNVSLPRAISFTAALYSLGIPPELIGTGRGLRIMKALGQESLLEKYYSNIKSDLEKAGRYVNKQNLLELIKQSSKWGAILDDIEAIESYLGKKLGPVTISEKKHYVLTLEIFKSLDKGGKTQQYIEKAALLRQSMG